MIFEEFEIRKFYKNKVKIKEKDGTQSVGMFNHFEFDVEDDGDMALGFFGPFGQVIYLENIESIEVVNG